MATAEDWSNYDMASARIQNQSNQDVRINFLIQISSDPNNYSGAYNDQIVLAPNETKCFTFVWRQYDPRTYGLRRIPPIFNDPFKALLNGQNMINAAAVYHWRFSYQGTAPAQVLVSNFRLLKYKDDFTGLADSFGQFTGREWTTKIHSVPELQGSVAAEDSDLSQNPGPGETNGSLTLPRQQPSTNWKTIRRADGKWYIVHPNGKLFWSMGLVGMTDNMATVTENRTNLFQTMPDRSGALNAFYDQGDTINGVKEIYRFYRQNLFHKFGNDYRPAYVALAKRRLASWGFNTIGAWSDLEFWDGSVPFTMYADTKTFARRLTCPYVYVHDLPDPFDPAFPTYLRSSLGSIFGSRVTNRNFMGAFVDNEMTWGWPTSNANRYNVALGALNAPVDQPAKTELRRQLRLKYTTIEALNAAWGTNFASWNAFANLTGYTITNYTSSMIADFTTYIRSFSAKYHSSVKTALNTIGFKGLYLGSRNYSFTPEVTIGASKYVDVLTFNMYGSYDQINWNLIAAQPRPVILSEFGFGQQADGNLGGPAEVYSDAERFDKIRAFMTAALHHPNVVGVHWFQYIDQPVSGRSLDGENYGVGMVDITDTPHPEAVAAFRASTAQMYEVRNSP